MRYLLFAFALLACAGDSDKDDSGSDGTDGTDDTTDETDNTPSATNGETLFGSNGCAGCHPAGGGTGPDLATAVPALSDDDLTSIISDGVSGTSMMAYGDSLGDSGVADIVAYLREAYP